jgi:hypothetical protein
MKPVYILEEEDTVRETDMCRPLFIRYDSPQGDSISFTSCYGNFPINNMKWLPFLKIYGKCWIGKSVREICKGSGPHEFLRERKEKQ